MDFNIPQYPSLQFGSVYCIGRNYDEHIREMKSDRPDRPVVFLKPRSSLIFNEGTIILPKLSSNVHHEVELVLLIGEKAQNVPEANALNYIKAVAVGIDVTARDLQTDAKKKGLPWSLSKGFDTFAPIGNFTDISNQIHLENLELMLKVNGEIRQSGTTAGMLFSCSEMISFLSKQFTLWPGDLIFTGTPEGVSRIKNGDIIEAFLQPDLSSLKIYVQ